MYTLHVAFLFNTIGTAYMDIVQISYCSARIRQWFEQTSHGDTWRILRIILQKMKWSCIIEMMISYIKETPCSKSDTAVHNQIKSPKLIITSYQLSPQ